MPKVMIEIKQASRLRDSFQVRSVLRASPRDILQRRVDREQEVLLGRESLMLLNFGECCQALIECNL